MNFYFGHVVFHGIYAFFLITALFIIGLPYCKYDGDLNELRKASIRFVITCLGLRLECQRGGGSKKRKSLLVHKVPYILLKVKSTFYT